MENLFRNEVNKMYFLSYIIALSILFSCQDEKSGSLQVEASQVDSSVVTNVDKGKKLTEESKIVVRGNSIVFFRINNTEYKDLIIRAGKYSKYDFDILFEKFEHLAKATQKITPSQDIKTLYTKATQIVFIDNKKDTFVFNRVEKDIIMGVAFYKGDSIPVIEQGVFSSNELKKRIMDFYNLKELNNIVIAAKSKQDFYDYLEDSIPSQIADTVKSP